MNGWKGIFQISNTGKVRRLYKRGPKELKSVVKRGGYKGVLLKANGIFKCELIHRLVATAFIPNPDNLPHVNRKDEDKTNDSIDNLDFATVSYVKEDNLVKIVIDYTNLDNSSNCKKVFGQDRTQSMTQHKSLMKQSGYIEKYVD